VTYDTTNHGGEEQRDLEHRITRKQFLGGAAAAGAFFAAPGLLTACGKASTTSNSTASSSPRKGGRLRVAMVGGGAAETMDPNAGVANIDSARAGALFGTLTYLKPDSNIEMFLADSFEPNADATVWTVRLRKGPLWSDGTPLVADDLIWTLNRLGSPSAWFFGASVVAAIDLKAMRKLDERTVRIPLHQPIAEFPFQFWTQQMAVIKNGQKSFEKPITMGPFNYVSFTPGQSSVFKANPDYWQQPLPYVDELELISMPDPGARLGALLGGQVDAIDQLTYEQAKAQGSGGSIRVLNCKGSNMVPIYMAVDLAPFTDVRVRQAMRLIADRPQLIESAQQGFGEVGNDLYGKGLLNYDDQLPQRAQDIEQAKSLLAAAGQADLKVALYTSQVAPGMLESATVFAQQAKAAGVTISVNKEPTDSYFGVKYLKQNFAQSQWLTIPIFSQYAQSLAPGAPYNETHWNDPAWTALWTDAIGELDEAKRKDKYLELQKILYDGGGYLVWGFYPSLDGLANNVQGVVPNPANELANFQFQSWWLG
jgi:peptide/nickel transport system substrate-binding protein